MDRRLDIALIQTRTPATAEAGLAHVEPLIRQAAAGGARFILTPEGTNLLEQRRDRRGEAIHRCRNPQELRALLRGIEVFIGQRLDPATTQAFARHFGSLLL